MGVYYQREAPSLWKASRQTWSDFVAANAKAADLQIMSNRLTVTMALAVSILSIFLALTSYRKGEKWSWFAFLVPGIIVWGSNVAYYITRASLMNMVLMLIGLVLLVIGLVIPAKAILGGEECPAKINPRIKILD